MKTNDWQKIMMLLLWAGAVMATEGDIAPVELRGSYRGGMPCLRWDAPEFGNPEGVAGFRVFRDNEVWREYRPGIEFECELVDENAPERAVYRVAALDEAGRCGALSNPFEAALLPDLAIDGNGEIDLNPDLSISRKFPIAGESFDVGARIHNRGAITAYDVMVWYDGAGSEWIGTRIAEIPAGEFREISFSQCLPGAGEYGVTLEIAAPEEIEEITRSNNQVSFRVNVVPDELHLVYYGNAAHLRHVSIGQGTTADVAEWRRRGMRAGIAVGCQGDAPSVLEIYRQAATEFDALLIDEIMGDHPTTETLLKVLPPLRQEFPDVFVAVWNIQDEVSPRIAELVKSGVIDLVMLEIYIKPGESLERLGQAAAKMRTLGIADKVIVGLVSNRTWSGGATDEIYTASLLAQLEELKRVYPESPGVAFWDTDAPAGMLEAADRKCRELYLMPEK